MQIRGLTKVEQSFFDRSGRKEYSTKIPYIVVQNFPDLGLLTSLRFLEWVSENPEGVISLPTGKTPEYFIKWTKQLLAGWDRTENRILMGKMVSYSIKNLHSEDYISSRLMNFILSIQNNITVSMIMCQTSI